MGTYALQVPELDGYYDVALHGSSIDFGIRSDHFTGIVGHRTVARLILNDPEYKGQAVRLIACSTGAGQSPIAQDLANKLGAPVMAPNDIVWVFPNGRVVIGPDQDTATGSWVVFTPGG
jgi:hypothetical protein